MGGTPRVACNTTESSQPRKYRLEILVREEAERISRNTRDSGLNIYVFGGIEVMYHLELGSLRLKP